MRLIIDTIAFHPLEMVYNEEVGTSTRVIINKKTHTLWRR